MVTSEPNSGRILIIFNMKVAKYRDDGGNEVIVDTFYDSLDLLRELSKDKRLYCPNLDCASRAVHLVDREDTIPYFKHFNNVNCGPFREESEEHKQVKRYLVKNLREDNPISKRGGNELIREEVNLIDTRPDVFLVLECSGEDVKVGVEYQRSYMGGAELRDKLTKNSREGIHTLYLFGNRFLPRYDRRNWEIRGMGELEGAALDLWEEMYFCILVGKERKVWRVGLEEKYSEGYDEEFEKRVPVFNDGEREQKHKSFETARFSGEEVDSLTLKAEEKDGLLIARFLTKEEDEIRKKPKMVNVPVWLK